MDISVIIVSYNTKEMLRDCLNALPDALRGLTAEIFVVDNASPDGSAAMVTTEFPHVRVLANTENVGFPCANNQAMAEATGHHIVLLNPDTEAEPDSLGTLVHYLDANPAVGIVGPKLLNTDGSLQRNGRRFPTLTMEFFGQAVPFLMGRDWEARNVYGREDFDTPCEVDVVSGACLVIRGETLAQIGPMDAGFFMFFEEIEWCWRAKKAGWKIAYLPQARVVHHWMGSVRQQPRAATKRYYESAIRYYGLTAGTAAQWGMRGIVLLGRLRLETRWLGSKIKGLLKNHVRPS